MTIDTGQAPTTTTDPASTTTDPAGQEPAARMFDAEYVGKLRAEAAAHRKEAADTKARLKSIEDAQLSETERFKKQSEEAQEAAKTATEKATLRITRAVALSEASQLGFADPSDAYALIDQTRIERDADGEPTNLDTLLAELATKKPYLLTANGTGTPAPVRTSATNAARPASSTNTFTTSQIADRAFWTANKDAIMRAMSEGRIVDDGG